MSGRAVEIPNLYSFQRGFEDDLIQISCEFKVGSVSPLRYTSFTLIVNDSSITETNALFSDQLYLMKLDEYEYLIIVHEISNDDDVLHIFRYDFDELIHLGNIPGPPNLIHTNPDGTLSSYIRGKVLQTWFYYADFVISNYYYSYDYSQYLTSKIVQMPNQMYPMGTQVILKRDLPVYPTKDSDDIAGTITTGATAVLVACDDIEWLYVESIGQEDSEPLRGYVRLADWQSIWIGHEQVEATAIFDGMTFAD